MRAFLFLLFTAIQIGAATTSYYIDPDYSGGGSTGAAATPWTSTASINWTTINSSLASGPVNIYCSALKADGTTQQSLAVYFHIQRHDSSDNRLTVDGHSFYNANVATPLWTANPTAIAIAYTNGHVFKLTGNGSQALGWARGDTSSETTFGGTNFVCIRSHVSGAANKPMSGASWTNYWDPHGSAGSAWATATAYFCGCKQDNVTMRGFEASGNGTRIGMLGDNLIYEYVSAHDCIDVGAMVSVLYTSFPDSAAAVTISAPNTNLIIRNFYINNTSAEGLYIGSINPDAAEQFQCDHGNQIDQMQIRDGFIGRTGTGGGQGDGIDCKNGITSLSISNIEIFSCSNSQYSVNVPQTFLDADMHFVIESCWIHGNTNGAVDSHVGIYAASSTVSCSPAVVKGYNGVTMRNNIIEGCKAGILASSTGNAKNIYVYNNNIRNITDLGIDFDNTDGGGQVINNIVWGCNGGGNQNAFTSLTESSNNAYAGSWSGTCVSCLSSVTGSHFTSESTSDYSLASGAPERNAGATVPGFTWDKTGFGRPNSTAWDIGPYEQAGFDLFTGPQLIRHWRRK
jgi:hypothetical protein